MRIDDELERLGISLPQIPGPGGNYLSTRRVGGLLFLSGAISMSEGAVVTGTAGRNRSTEEGYAAARLCALTQLAVMRAALGSLDLVRSIVSVNGYVNAVAEFAESPQVINGASDLFVEVFGERGRHVRAAVGVCALPRNALVELQMVVEV